MKSTEEQQAIRKLQVLESSQGVERNPRVWGGIINVGKNPRVSGKISVSEKKIQGCGENPQGVGRMCGEVPLCCEESHGVGRNSMV